MRRMSLLVVLAFLVVVPSAQAMIQLDRGIAGARLGASPAQVRAALGKPTKTARGRNDFGPWLRYVFAGGIGVFFQGRKEVTSVQTTGFGDRTAKGVGVGSTQDDVVSGVPHVECETVESSLTCHTRDLLPGQRVTDFRIENGKVVRVTVAIVFD
jgi:hypothetical protein